MAGIPNPNPNPNPEPNPSRSPDPGPNPSSNPDPNAWQAMSLMDLHYFPLWEKEVHDVLQEC